jgi:RNA polymerase sigma factor (sigma-70 family)
MAEGIKYPFAEQGLRLRWLRLAERFNTVGAFADHLGWPQSGVSHFETGTRRVPTDKALQLRDQIPGFDPMWLWTGDKRGLSFDLRQRIDAEEAGKRLEFDHGRQVLAGVIDVLNPRERRIFEARRLAEHPMTLEELGAEFGVTRERVRQIEARAIEKVQSATIARSGS